MVFFIRVYFKNYDNKLYEDIICLIYFIFFIWSYFVMFIICVDLKLIMMFFKLKIKLVSVF